MNITPEQCKGLGVALNEADLLGFEVDAERRVASATFRVLTLPEAGPAPDDRRMTFLFRPVGRVAASLREGPWDDPAAPVVPFAIHELLAIVQSFGGLPVYGGEFIDHHAKELQAWGHRLSLDWASGADITAHSVSFFQDSGDQPGPLRWVR